MPVTGLPYIFKNGAWTPMSTDARVGKDRALDGAILNLADDIVYDPITNKVTQWTDKSGYGNHAGPHPYAALPLYNGVTPHGTKSVRFARNAGLYIPTFNMPPTQDITFFFGIYRESSGGFIFSASYNVGNEGFVIHLPTTQIGILIRGNVGISQIFGSSMQANRWHTGRAELFKSKPTEEAGIYLNGIVDNQSSRLDANNTNGFAPRPASIGCEVDGANMIDASFSRIIAFPFKVTGDHAAYIESRYILNSY